MAKKIQFYNYSFQKRTDQSDGAGNFKSIWEEQFTARGQRVFFRGREKVIAAAETGTQELIIKIRNHESARLVSTDWRVVDKRTGETYNVRGIEPDVDNRNYIDFLVQSGVADG